MEKKKNKKQKTTGEGDKGERKKKRRDINFWWNSVVRNVLEATLDSKLSSPCTVYFLIRVVLDVLFYTCFSIVLYRLFTISKCTLYLFVCVCVSLYIHI